ncbi:MAG TPA: hypothetical protein ENK59_07910 [Thioploca sp.]|nr:hypothetical protein [Thioploca sp.]
MEFDDSQIPRSYWKAKRDLVNLDSAMSMGISIDLIIQITRKELNKNCGTWIEPYVAINLAQWCSPEFVALITKWTFKLLTKGYIINFEIIYGVRLNPILNLGNRGRIRNNANKFTIFWAFDFK